MTPAIAIRSVLLAVAAAALLPATVSGQSGRAIPQRERVQLSDSVQVTLVFLGEAPIRVDLPEHLLAPESDRDWKIRPVGPATVCRVLGAAACWQRTYRLDPYVPGSNIHVGFSPVRVNGQEVTPTGFTITVLSNQSEPKPENARPVTGIEELPPPPSLPAASSNGLWGVGAVAAAAAVAALLWRVRRKPRAIPAEVWAARELDRLAGSGVTGATLAERVAEVIREFIARRWSMAAPRMTTAELLAAAEQAGWSVEITDPLRGLLEICDRAKFAGDVLDDGGSRRLLGAGQEWIDRVCAAAGPR